MANRVYELRWPNGNRFRFFEENLELARSHAELALAGEESFCAKYGNPLEASLHHLGFNANVNDDRY